MVDDVKKFSRSLSHAFDGLSYALKRERNFQIELVCGVFVLALILIFKVKNWEAVVLIVMVAGVLIMELANTVMERIVDMLKPKVHPYARLIKDIMAAAVLISSCVAALVGVIIFYPYMRELLGL
ncbi:MAG TPA: diacylglycerol kinase [Candidatus Moranbacteria bacterium]|nr:MAG: diacylglycerol kinase [Candidatus Moranbacteria bacterium GW2011_GWC2_45_10]KKT95271.1 MAG: diacylglycerol kinase [Parcubacteria group bacterium GW2011_GWC1_45_14]HAV10962.1 diacylglycerol kinase [Candidatus Moranbacteria bacterium]